MKYDKTERIVSAAIVIDNTGNPHISNEKECPSEFVISGPRHCHCIENAKRFGFTEEQLYFSQKGFITNNNNFVSRKKALQMAKLAKQIGGQSIKTELTSEDLY